VTASIPATRGNAAVVGPRLGLTDGTWNGAAPVFSAVLPPTIYPQVDTAVVECMEAYVAVLTPQQLDYVKAPPGHLTFAPGILGRSYRPRYWTPGSAAPYEFHAPEQGAEQQAGNRAHRLAERELVGLALRIACPSAAAAGSTPLMHHFGVRDGISVAAQHWARHDDDVPEEMPETLLLPAEMQDLVSKPKALASAISCIWLVQACAAMGRLWPGGREDTPHA
jgi:hypothetical protein